MFFSSEKWSSYWWRNVNWLRRKFSRRRRTLLRQTRVGWSPRRNSFFQWRWPLIQASWDSRQPSLRDISIHLRKHKTKWWSSKSFDHKHHSHSHHKQSIVVCRTCSWQKACSGCSMRIRAERSTSMSFFRSAQIISDQFRPGSDPITQILKLELWWPGCRVLGSFFAWSLVPGGIVPKIFMLSSKPVPPLPVN